LQGARRCLSRVPVFRAPGSHTWTRAGSTALLSPTELWGTVSHDVVGSANLNWNSLGFEYVPTCGHVRFVWKDGKWDSGTFHKDPFVSVHILGNVFHYGQALFEGFKGFHTRDDSVVVFGDNLSLQRLTHGCRRFRMPEIPRKMWEDAVDETVRKNVSFVPPYGTGGALYLRPFLFGSGPKLGLGPSPEYTFVVFANPTGSYYRTNSMEALDGLVNDDYDRAAPLGCGDCKAAGNYAADLESMKVAKEKGFPISLYLDASERRYTEEFNTSNFVAITKDGRYITPEFGRSILASNTNRVLQKIAADLGIKVEQRPIDFEAEVDNFAEVGGVGTAVVVTPIRSLTRRDRTWYFGEANVLKQLHDKVRAVQQGEEPDPHGWMRVISLTEKFKKPLLSIYPGL